MDRHWNVLLTNDAAPRFFGGFIDLAARPKPRNLLHLMFDPAGMRPFVADWPSTSRLLIGRVRREAVGRTVDADTRRLLEQLACYPDVETTPLSQTSGDDLPVIPLTFVKDGITLRYFSLLTTVATPQAVSAEELRLESMLPADEETERRHGEFVRIGEH